MYKIVSFNGNVMGKKEIHMITRARVELHRHLVKVNPKIGEIGDSFNLFT